MSRSLLVVTEVQVGRARELVEDRLDDVQLAGLEVVTDYSARDMFGVECVGIVGTSPAVAALFLVALAEVVGFDLTDLLAELVRPGGWMTVPYVSGAELTYWPGIRTL